MQPINLDMSEFPIVALESETVLLRAGTKTGTVYALKSGSVRVETGGRVLAHVNTPNAFFGEISVLLDREHSADTICESDSSFYVIEDFEGLAVQRPELALAVARLLAERVVQMNQTVVLMSMW